MMSDGNNHQTRYFERLSLSQRIQHIVLMSSFTLLVITGLPVRYHDSAASEIVVRSMGGMVARGAFHRIAAVILICVCVYHIFWTLFTKRGHEEFLALIPKPKDGFDLLRQIKFYFGLAPTRPSYDRFNWIEKFEYLAMGWGSVVMIGTGFLLWFESQAMLVLPKWTLDIAQVAHSYEALLAFLAIIIWHFYHVHMNEHSFPMSKTWINGLISEEELKDHHPLEYERIIREIPVPAEEPEKQPEEEEVRTPVGK